MPRWNFSAGFSKNRQAKMPVDWRRSIVQCSAGLIVAALLFLGGEGILRLLPIDRWERSMPNLSSPVFVPGAGQYAGEYVTSPQFLGAMKFQHFAQKKPTGVKRVFILGGSAALGWPGPIQAAFSSYMQRALDQTVPGKFEIVNVAALSYGSLRVLDLLNDLVNLEPDLVVIWSGNNEYVERNAFSAFGRATGVRKLQRVLRYSYVYRALRLGLGTVAPSLFARPDGADITDLRKTPKVNHSMFGRSRKVDLQILQNYEANLTAMARLIRRSGAAGIFCTVPVNLAGWAAASMPPTIDDPLRAQEWSAAMEQILAFCDQRNYGAAAAGLERLLTVTPEDAFAHYLLGDCYLHLGRVSAARAEFERARDFDPRPGRALSTFEQTIRDVSAREGMTLIDLEAAFASASASGVPGLDLFLDYVHPNEIGHKLAAKSVLSRVVALLEPGLPLSQLAQRIDGDAWLAQNDFNQADIIFTQGMTLYNNGDLVGAERAYLRALELDPKFPEPAGNLGVLYEERGDLPAAHKYYQLAAQLDPGTFNTSNLVRYMFRHGDRGEAREIAERFLQKGHADPSFLTLLGDIETADSHDEQALAFYRSAADMGEISPELQTKIGDLYRKLGDEANARAAYARAAAAR